MTENARSSKYIGPITYYADDGQNCKTSCKQQGNPNKVLAPKCPCGYSSPDCHSDTSCSGSDTTNDPHRICK